MPIINNNPGIFSNRAGNSYELPFRLGTGQNIAGSPVGLGMSSRVKGLYAGYLAIYHPEAINWVNRAQANGGSISYQTLDAVSAFCYAIDSANIRDRFMRLNLFCGNNLASCLVPLYTNTSMNYTDVGNAIDTNHNFVDGDYSGSTGLTGDGNTKVLETGVSEYQSNSGNDSVSLNSHMSVYAITKNGADQYMMGTFNYYMGATYLLQMGSSYSLLILDNASTLIQSTVHPMSGDTSSTLTGLTIGTTNNTLGKIYNDNTDITNSFINDGSNANIYNICVFGSYDDDNEEVVANSDASLGAYSFGNYMTPTQVANYTSAMNTFQTAIWRNNAP